MVHPCLGPALARGWRVLKGRTGDSERERHAARGSLTDASARFDADTTPHNCRTAAPSRWGPLPPARDTPRPGTRPTYRPRNTAREKHSRSSDSRCVQEDEEAVVAVLRAAVTV
eukprot:4876537-Prymnesium_polylepis.1